MKTKQIKVFTVIIIDSGDGFNLKEKGKFENAVNEFLKQYPSSATVEWFQNLSGQENAFSSPIALLTAIVTYDIDF